ncbi:MAG: hypothetical protein K0B10_15475 [Vicingaceae bacterium]|nr:hypothetical protein [Vicingaceae bacterium]
MVQKYSQLTKAHQLIKKQIKGTPEEIANLLGMSKSSMYRVFEELEQLGAEYKYCRTCMCFKYTNNFKLKVTIETNEMTKILGGQQNNFQIPDIKHYKLFFNKKEEFF